MIPNIQYYCTIYSDDLRKGIFVNDHVLDCFTFNNVVTSKYLKIKVDRNNYTC